MRRSGRQNDNRPQGSLVFENKLGRRLLTGSSGRDAQQTTNLRRGCAQRLINAGVSAETLKVVLRHKDFTTTEKFYGATRAAQSAAAEIYDKLVVAATGSEDVRRTPEQQLSADELRKLKALLEMVQ